MVPTKLKSWGDASPSSPTDLRPWIIISCSYTTIPVHWSILHNCVHLYCRFNSASRAPYVPPENEADNGEDDNPEMITTFQLGGDAIGNVFFLVARDLILSQFSIDCCQNAFVSGALPQTPLEGLQRPQTPSWKNWVTHTDSPVSWHRKWTPPFQILATGLTILMVPGKFYPRVAGSFKFLIKFFKVFCKTGIVYYSKYLFYYRDLQFIMNFLRRINSN